MPLDLAEHYDDVRRLAGAHPRFRKAVAKGFDPDDLMQDVLMRILSRQRGRSAYDPERGSLGKYVFVAVSGIVQNYERDHRHELEERQHGAEDPLDGGSLTESDRSDEVATAPRHGEDLRGAIRRVVGELCLDETDRVILTRLAAGDLRRDIRRDLGLPSRARGDEVDRIHLVLERVRRHLRPEREKPTRDAEVVPFTVTHGFDWGTQGRLFPARVLYRRAPGADVRQAQAG